MTEDEMVGWHHRLNGHGFGWTLGKNSADTGRQRNMHPYRVKLKLQYFGHLMQRVDSLEKTLMLGKIGGRRRRGRQRMRPPRGPQTHSRPLYLPQAGSPLG